MLSAFLQNLTVGARSIVRDRARSALAILTLAVGIAGTTTIFALVDVALLRPLPYADPDRLVVIWDRGEPGGRTDLWLAPPEYRDIAEHTRTLTSVGALQDLAFNLTGTGAPVRVSALATTASLLPTLGVRLERGRGLAPEEDRPGAPLRAIVAFDFWQARFGGADDVVGRTIALDGRPYEIIGVLPRGFALPKLSSVLPDRPDLLVAFEPHLGDGLRNNRTVNMLHVLGRRQPQASLATVQDEMDAVVRDIAPRHANEYVRRTWALSVADLQDYVRAPVRPALVIMLVMASLMLALACANAASLLLTRAERRRTELAVRVALGASPRRLASQLLTESLVLAMLGGILGSVIAAWLIEFAIGAIPDPQLVRGLRLDARALGFATAATLVSGLAAGLAPLLVGRARNLQAVMQEGGRSTSGRSSRLAAALVGAEVAIAFSLLLACALLVQTFARLTRVDPGFTADGVFSAAVSLPPSYQQGAEAASLFEHVVEGLATQPGVVAAGAVSQLPFSGQVLGSAFAPQSGPRAGEDVPADLRGVTSGYFETLGIPLVEGRRFNAADRADAAAVAIVDRSLADRLWPGRSAVGQRVVWIRGRVELEVVGVVGAVRHDGPRDTREETVYRPIAQYPRWTMSLVVKTAQDPSTIANTVAAVVRRHDGALPVTRPMPLAVLMARSLDQPRLSASVATVSAIAALALAVVGIYGVVSQVAGRRAREIAIRLAIGGRPSQVVALMVRQGTTALLAGLIAGAFMAWALANALAGLLFGVAATDLTTFAICTVTIAAAGLIACWIPARRSVRTSVLTVLRGE